MTRRATPLPKVKLDGPKQMDSIVPRGIFSRLQ